MTGTSSDSAGPGTSDHRYTIGIDFGTLSGRAVVIRVADGAQVGSAVHDYEHAVMDERLTAGPSAVPLPPDWALQVPSDYIGVLRTAVPAAIAAAEVDPRMSSASPPTSLLARSSRSATMARRCASWTSSAPGHTPT